MARSEAWRLTGPHLTPNGVGIHDGTADGVMDAVRNMFAGIPHQPLNRRQDFRAVYETLTTFRRTRDGRGNPYTAVQFGSLVVVAKGAVDTLATRHVSGLGRELTSSHPSLVHCSWRSTLQS